MSLMENNLFVHFCWVLLKYFLSWKVKNCLRSVQDKSIISFHETYVASSLFLNKLLCKQVRQQVFDFNICPFEDDRVVCFQCAVRGTGDEKKTMNKILQDTQSFAAWQATENSKLFYWHSSVTMYSLFSQHHNFYH